MKNKKGFWGVVLGYFAIVGLLFALEMAIESAEGDVTPIYAGWSVSCIGRTSANQEIEDLSETGLLPLGQGTEISFSHLLPDMNALTLPAVMIDAGRNALQVYLEDELIYEAQALTPDVREQEQMHIAGLPEDYAQKELMITVTVTDPEVFTGLKAPLLGNYDDLMRARGNNAVVALITGFFMMVFGLISLVILALRYFQMKRPDAYVLSAALTFMLGFWLSMSAELQTLFLPSFNQKTTIMTAMILSFVLFAVYFLSIPKRLMRRLKNREWEEMASGDVLLLVDMFGLFFIMIIQAIFTITELTLHVGLSMYLRRTLPFFTALIIMIRAYRYSTFIKEVYIKREENQSLYKIAYGDSLTGLYNRACWDEKMQELDRSDDPYCIISMDLDGLKTVNDTMGHEGGDCLIKGFAKAVSKSFRKEKHFVARVGGDEFVVIMMTADEEEVKNCLATLEIKLKDLDKNEKDLVHRCSYGYEFSDSAKKMQKGLAPDADAKGTAQSINETVSQAENSVSEGAGSGVNHTAHDIYMLADAKMYKNKQTHKAADKAVAMTQSASTEAKVAEIVKKTQRAMNGEPVEEEEVVTATEAAKPRPAEGKQISLETDADVRKAMANLRTPIHRASTPQAGAPLAPGAKAAPAAVPGTPAVNAAQIQAAARAQMGMSPKTPEQTVAQIQENEIRQVAKDAKVKKALQALEEAQKAQK